MTMKYHLFSSSQSWNRLQSLFQKLQNVGSDDRFLRNALKGHPGTEGGLFAARPFGGR